MSEDTASFQQMNVDIDILYLNRENYRIDFTKFRNDTEAIPILFEEEGIIEMASDIVSFKGLYPNETLLVVEENGRKIILEGNRRALAIKCIVHRELVPEQFREEFNNAVGTVTQDIINRIRSVAISLVPTRDSVLRIISDKHADYGVKKWVQVSKWKFMKDAFNKFGRDADRTAEELRAEKSTVVDFVKFYNLLAYIRNLDLWGTGEIRKEIDKNGLEPTKMTRALGMTDIIAAIGLQFDAQYEVTNSEDIPIDKFNFVIFHFAKASLIDTEGDTIDTRSSKEEILLLINKWKTEYDATHREITAVGSTESNPQSPSSPDTPSVPPTTQSPQNPPIGGGRNHGGRRSVKYFGRLVCTASDQRLLKLSEELSSITVKKYPAATIMLTRALIESSLVYQIKKKNLWGLYKRQCRQKCDLDSVISFSITNKDALFTDPTIANPLNFLQGNGGHRRFMNDVVHGNWVDPTPAAVEAIAGDTRELLRAILDDSA